ncbi:MAG: carbohydrate kinase family protein [Spirochaetaceae bacterium]|nr:carbohydrate kinase family protein [Treponema sp.]MBO5235528.1 carbohydrate kinase family protein [Spirochaetaceae bacterium]
MESIVVSGLFNIETNTRIRSFPINYYPIDYNFFGVSSYVGGVGFNISKALKTLGSNVLPISMLGKDINGKNIVATLQELNIPTEYLFCCLKETPASVVLYDEAGRRQIYCDLKDIQEVKYDFSLVEKQIENSSLVVACNTNFNRPLLSLAKQKGKIVATDVHVLSNIHDEYNKDFLEKADIVFLSDELLPSSPKDFLFQLKETYGMKIIVLGQGEKGATLYSRDKDKFFRFSAVKPEKVVNTVGAGDALFSGFVFFYSQGFDEIEALKRGEIFASIKIGFDGASNGFSSSEKIEKVYKNTIFEIQEI